MGCCASTHTHSHIVRCLRSWSIWDLSLGRAWREWNPFSGRRGVVLFRSCVRGAGVGTSGTFAAAAAAPRPTENNCIRTDCVRWRPREQRSQHKSGCCCRLLLARCVALRCEEAGIPRLTRRHALHHPPVRRRRWTRSTASPPPPNARKNGRQATTGNAEKHPQASCSQHNFLPRIRMHSFAVPLRTQCGIRAFER
jgi:hypothetical protein